jgi:hypothetical protein
MIFASSFASCFYALRGNDLMILRFKEPGAIRKTKPVSTARTVKKITMPSRFLTDHPGFFQE